MSPLAPIGLIGQLFSVSGRFDEHLSIRLSYAQSREILIGKSVSQTITWAWFLLSRYWQGNIGVPDTSYDMLFVILNWFTW